MITQAKIKIEKTAKAELNSALGAKIHGWLLNQVSDELSAKLHAFGEVRPFSLFVQTDYSACDWLVINILDDSAMALLDVFNQTETIAISGLKESVKILGMAPVKTVDFEELFEKTAYSEAALHFITPATYKLNNRYTNWFDLSRLIMGVIKKINTFETIKLDRRSFYELDEQVEIKNYQLKSSPYLINGNYINGVMGSMQCRINGDTEKDRLLKGIINYSEYAGIGAKTAMGMGGFQRVASI